MPQQMLTSNNCLLLHILVALGDSSLTYLTYCPDDNDVVSACWQPTQHTVFLHLFLFVASC